MTGQPVTGIGVFLQQQMQAFQYLILRWLLESNVSTVPACTACVEILPSKAGRGAGDAVSLPSSSSSSRQERPPSQLGSVILAKSKSSRNFPRLIHCPSRRGTLVSLARPILVVAFSVWNVSAFHRELTACTQGNTKNEKLGKTIIEFVGTWASRLVMGGGSRFRAPTEESLSLLHPSLSCMHACAEEAKTLQNSPSGMWIAARMQRQKMKRSLSRPVRRF